MYPQASNILPPLGLAYARHQPTGTFLEDIFPLPLILFPRASPYVTPAPAPATSAGKALPYSFFPAPDPRRGLYHVDGG